MMRTIETYTKKGHSPQWYAGSKCRTNHGSVTILTVIPNSSVSGDPKNAAGRRCPRSVFQQIPAGHEPWPTEDRFPSADRRSSFVRWLGVTRGRQKLVDYRRSPMRQASI